MVINPYILKYNHDHYIFIMIKEVITTVKLTQNKVYMTIDMLKRLSLENGDMLVWALNENKELVLVKANMINKDSKYDFL